MDKGRALGMDKDINISRKATKELVMPMPTAWPGLELNAELS